MGLSDKLSLNCIETVEGLAGKQEVLQALARLAKKSEYLKSIEEKRLRKLLEEREAAGTTGFGGGIAIPHCNMPGLDDFTVGILISPEGVSFDSLDDKPVHVFFLIVGPREKHNEHIQLLSAISKLLKDKKVVATLKDMESPQAVIGYLKEQMGEGKDVPTSNKYSQRALFQIMIQKDEYLNDIIEIISAEKGSSMTILEGENAGYYLHNLPLFSAYWTEGKLIPTKMIVANVRKASCNNIIRQINTLDDTINEESGIMITVQELFYSSGSVDF